ncbi:MAG: BatA and WFA domain-containing protein [Clostridia bacterium]|nr:BatA and WFA domain-containing protein [Clostridia bacterium]
MSFVQPLGLLALIGIPVLVLIYIIKSKYTEQVIPSTYLWQLSEKFLKHKRPVSKLASILGLILQCVIVVAIALTIAQPVFTIPNSAKEYCFLLDGTGSMNTQDGGQTRFDRAKDEVKDIINKSKSGSNYALVFIGDTTYTVFEGINNKKSANITLDGMECTWSSADCSEALNIAQKYFDANSSTQIYLLTDKSYDDTQNVTVINVSSGEENYAVTDYTNVKKYNSETNTEGYLVSASVISYNSDAVLTVELVADGKGQETRNVSVTKL